MQDLEVLALPLSNTFPSLPALSCPFLLFTILSSPLLDRGTNGRMYGQTELIFMRCLQKKKKGGHTHGQTDILSYYYIILELQGASYARFHI